MGPKILHIKIISQKALGAAGLVQTYGVIINGYPKYIFYSKSKCEAFIGELCQK